MKRAIKFAAATAVLAMALPASAAVIVDTGVRTTGPAGDYALDLTQGLAAGFSTAATTITSVKGYMGPGFGTSYTIALYTSGGPIPDTELFSGVVASSTNEGFQGLTGINWAVAAGDYFVAFEVRPGQRYEGSMPDRAVTPLSIYAIALGGTAYGNFNDLNLAVRIEGDTGVGGIPEPASWALLIAGFGLTGAIMRRQRAVTA